MVNSVYAVEVSGACNLEATCKWCPMHNRPRSRKRGLMREETISRALYYVEKLGPPPNEPVFLHNFGEPLLHPSFDDIALRFSRVCSVSMSTNGVLLDDTWADRLARVPWAWISLSPWDMKAVERAGKLLAERGVCTKYPSGVTHDWAGQAVEGKSQLFSVGCPFLVEKKLVIRWDGTLASCCISDRQEDVIGFAEQEPESIEMRAYTICNECHHGKGK